MRANTFRAVVICAMAGVAVSCVVAPHTINGSIDYPQARKGAKVRFSSYDGLTYDITFGANTPCKEGSTLTVSPGTPATCTVSGPEGHMYPYSLTVHVNGTPPVPAPPPKVASTVCPRALIVPCHGCIGAGWSRNRRSAPKRLRAAPNVGTRLPLGASIDVKKTGIDLFPPEECTSTDTNGACAYQNQQVQWSLEEGSQLVIHFTGDTPCVDGSGKVNPLPTGDTSKPNTLPVSCAIGGTPGNYPYTFQIDGITVSATLKVARP